MGLLAIGMLLMLIRFYTRNKTKKILVTTGIGIIGLIVEVYFGLGAALITVGVITQIIGFFLILVA